MKISSIAQVLKGQSDKENSKLSEPEISIKSQQRVNLLCPPKRTQLERVNLAPLKLQTAQSQLSDRGQFFGTLSTERIVITQSPIQ